MTIKMLNSSGLNVGINFKHLKAGSGKTPTGISVQTGNKHTEGPTHTKKHTIIGRRTWELFFNSAFTFVPLREEERTKENIFVFACSEMCEKGNRQHPL